MSVKNEHAYTAHTLMKRDMMSEVLIGMLSVNPVDSGMLMMNLVTMGTIEFYKLWISISQNRMSQKSLTSGCVRDY